MIRKLLSTTASRMLIALLNLAIVWINARYLGPEVLGTISLIILGISIIQLVTAVLAGSSLVYQTSRHKTGELFSIAFVWTIISSIPVWFILLQLALLPEGYEYHVLYLSLIGSIITINQNIFLGKERISIFNSISIMQSVMLLITLYFVIFKYNLLTAGAYVIAQYISMVITLLFAMVINYKHIADFRMPRYSVIKEGFQFGAFLQTASIIQLFNYRLSYYLIEKFFDRATLGIFSLGVQLAESIWIIAKSMAILLYSRLSNNRDDKYAIVLTLKFVKFTATVTTFLIIVLLIIPSQAFVFVFNAGFEDIRHAIISLAPGILSVAISLMFSHYFSGTGFPKFNTISSGIGLVLTIVLGFILIPVMGITGAGITASFSYFSSMLYQALIFKKRAGAEWKDFLPTSNDVVEIKAIVKTTISAN